MEPLEGAKLAQLEQTCPELAGLLLDSTGAPRSDYRVAINGGSVCDDASAALSDGDALVVLHAHAGG